METRKHSHPSALQLAALALGKLAPESHSRLQRHVNDCDSCAGFVADTPRADLVALLRNAMNATNIADQSTPSVRDAATSSGLPNRVQQAATSADSAANDAGQETPSMSRSVQSSATDNIDDEVPDALRSQSKYRIERLLGRGGMGSVYQAYHERMDRMVAIKIVNSALVSHPEALQRFDQEVKAAAKLDHPNVARAYDADEFDSLRVLVMEYVPGISLEKFLANRGRLTVVEACRLIRQAMIGLDHANARGMVHRDLKPQNLMLTPNGKVKILDFGLAKLASERHGGAGLTRDNALMGTPHYLAPEQALDAAKADIRADIYSLGCTLYCLLNGAPPFQGDTEMKVLLAHQNEAPRPLCEICPDVPRALSDLVDRMLAKNPDHRPQTPREVAEALLPFAKGEFASPQVADHPLAFLEGASPKVATPGSPRPEVRSTSRPNGLWFWSGGAAVALLLMAFAAWSLGVFTVKTPKGTIVIVGLPDDVNVHVDGASVTLARNGEEVTISAVHQGEHHLKFVAQRQGDLDIRREDRCRRASAAGELRSGPQGAGPRWNVEHQWRRAFADRIGGRLACRNGVR